MHNQPNLKQTDINKIIDLLEDSSKDDNAYFSINQYGGGTDECFISANKQGLESFSQQLLLAARESNAIIKNDTKNIIPLDIPDNWYDGDVCLHYIEPIITPPNKKSESLYKERWYDKLIPIMFFLLLIGLGISAVIGIITIINWI